MAPLPAAQQARLDAMAYLFRQLEAGKPHAFPGFPRGELPLPVPPQTFRPRQSARIGLMQTREYGIADEQGLSAPEWQLEGQFLVQPSGGHGNYGHQRRLEAYVRHYLLENRARGQARKPLLTMAFHDFYADEHWIVVPQVVPLGQMDSSHPTTERYSLNLMGVRPYVGTEPENPALRQPKVYATAHPDAAALNQSAFQACPNWTGTACRLAACDHAAPPVTA